MATDLHDASSAAPIVRGFAMSAEELALLIDSATNHAIYMLDREARVTIWKRGAERIEGWTEAEVIGRHFQIFFSPEEVAAGMPQEDFDPVHREGRVEEESRRVRKDGSELLASVTITAVHDDAGARG